MALLIAMKKSLLILFPVLFIMFELFSQTIQPGRVFVEDTYDEGEQVLIKAEADQGYLFSAWSGDYTGIDNPAVITMDSNITVSAMFSVDNTLLGYWKMDETEGTTLYDNSSLSNNIELNNSNNSTFVDGKLDGAVYFDGTRDGILESATGFQSASFTIAVYLKANPEIDDWMWIAAHADNYGIYFNAAGMIESYQYNESGWEGVVGKQKIRDGQWHHVAATFDNETKEMKIYIDGELDNSRMLSMSTIFTTGNDFHIGTMNGERNYFGALDELSVYNRALSQQEIADFVIGGLPHNHLEINIVGSGTVAASPNNISYTDGTEVTLTATAPPNGQFLGWNGDINSVENPVTLVMDTNKFVTAYFYEVPPMVYYVSKTGNDNNDGSINNPWATISHASRHLFPGDTLIVMQGTYQVDKEVINNAGMEGKYITIKGEEGVIIEGSTTNSAYGVVNIQESSYLILDNINVRNALTHGIKVMGKCNNIIIRNCKTEHTRGCGIQVQGSYGYPWDREYYISNILLENNEIHWPQEGRWDGNNIWHEDITLMQGVEHFEIRNNYVNAYDSIQYDGGPIAIDVKDGVRYGKVHHNTVENIPSNGLYIDAWDTYAHHIDIYQNYVHNCTGHGIEIGAERGGPVDSVKVYNNIVSKVGWVGISSGDYNGGSGPTNDKKQIDIYNNTIYMAGMRGWGCGINTESSYKEGKIYNNILFDCQPNGMDLNLEDNNMVTNNCIYESTGNDSGDEGENVVKKDPLFNDVLKEDFRILKASPCVDAGLADGAPDIDYEGTSRPQGDGYDIGAYEENGVGTAPDNQSPVSGFKVFPNPTKGEVFINYSLNENTAIEVVVYDISGKVISELLNESQHVGFHTIYWDGSEFPSGVYFVKVQTGYKVVSSRIVLNK